MPHHYRLTLRIEPIDDRAQVLTGHPATRLKQFAMSERFEADVVEAAGRLAREAVRDVLAMNRDASAL